MMAVLGWAVLICVACGALIGVLAFYSHQKEQREIRREHRTGLTPPNGTPYPEVRIPIHFVRAVEDSVGKIHGQNELILQAMSRIEALLRDDVLEE